MAITYIGASAHATSTTNSVVVSAPANHQSGDILVLMGESYEAIPSIPSGWVNVGSANNNDEIQARVCYKIATSSSESSVTMSVGTGEDIQAIMFCFRGVDTSNPINAATPSVSEGDLIAAGVTTTVVNCMLVTCVGFWDNNDDDTASYSNWTCLGANPTTLTELVDFAPNDFMGEGLAAAYGLLPNIGASSNVTATTDSADNHSATVVFALKPLPTATNVSADVPLATITNAQIIAPSVSVTVNISAEAPATTASAELVEPVITVTANIAVDVPLAEATAQIETPSASATEGETSVTASVPISTATVTIGIPDVSAENGDVSVTVDVPASILTSALAVPRIINAITNPLMTVDALGNISIRGSIKIGSSIGLDLFGNLTAVEFIAGDKISISADSRLTAKSITEGMA